MLRVGLTGNIASGKSTVAQIWARRGAWVIDADLLARRAVAAGSPGLERVVEAFGSEVLGSDGELDRAALRRIVFSDPEARVRLESIVHPEVARLREAEEVKARESGAGVVVNDIPLLFEVGLEDEFDLIVLVDSPEEVRLARLVEGRGLHEEEARAMIEAQLPASAKRDRADYLIENRGTLRELEERAEGVWLELEGQRSPGECSSAGSGLIRIDMHLHTLHSFDSLSDPEEVLRVALARGIDRICVTDHNEIAGALELKARYPDRVIVGEEVKTREGVDIIGLYLGEAIPKGTPARETCERIRGQGGLVYIPHPFARGKGGGGRILPEVVDLVDIVEGFNARIHDQRLNDAAVAWARAHDLAIGAGSDAHTLREVGRGYVEVSPFEDEPGAFLEAVRGGRIEGRLSSWGVHLGSTFAKIRKWWNR